MSFIDMLSLSEWSRNLETFVEEDLDSIPVLAT